MKYKNIECVDGGDNGRAPIAAAACRKLLEESRVRGVDVYSSGTMVNFTLKATDAQLARAVSPFLQVALETGALTPDQITQIREGREVKQLVLPIIRRLTDDETERAQGILFSLGLTRYCRYAGHPKQTIPNRGADGLIFAIGNENYRRVNGIYQATQEKPQIELLGDFKDPFFSSFAAHKQIAEEIIAATRSSLAKYI
jgi:hypothetical protein